MAIAFQNSTGLRIATAASTWSIPVQTGLTGGGFLAVGVSFPSSNVSVSTMTDNVGNTFTLAKRAAGTPAISAELWYAANISSGSTRIEIGVSALSSGTMAVGHWTGVKTASPLLVTGSSQAAASSGAKTASVITPTEDNALVVMYAGIGAAVVVSTGSGLSIWNSTAATNRAFGEYVIQTTATATDGPYSVDASAAHAEAIAAFGQQAAGGATTAPRLWRSGLLGVQ